MGASLNPLADTTELDAVNRLLLLIGERPIPDFNTPRADVDEALLVLRTTARRVLAEGWRFNTEFGLEIRPAAGSPFTWTEPDATTTQLNIFRPPANLLSFVPSRTQNQLDWRDLDVALRVSKQFQDGGVNVPVFYDRYRNRDGFVASERTALFIDATFALPFNNLPQVAKDVIIGEASIDYIGLKELSAVQGNAIAAALQADRRRLFREEGDVDDDANMFDTFDVYLIRGGRDRLSGGFYDDRLGRSARLR